MSGSSETKKALITGASSGIGAVYAERLAARGYDVVLVARRADRLKGVADKIKKTYGSGVEVIVADLEKESDVARVEKVLAGDSAIEVLVNNAGVAHFKPLPQMSLPDAVSQIAVNVTALTRLTHAVLPAFLARNEGTIINIASVLSIHSRPYMSVYSGTKGYVMNFTRGLQEALAETNIKVQLVLPATTATEIWEAAGIPLSSLKQDSIMSTEEMVDAALSGFDQGEKITWPSVADPELWDKYDAARSKLFASSQTGTPAPRYKSLPQTARSYEVASSD